MESLLKQASAMKRRTGQVEVESMLTKAMDSVETIKKAGNTHKREADRAIVKAYQIYQQMQKLATQPDFFIGTDRNHPDRVVSVSRNGPNNSYNYARVQWDAASMMAVTKGSPGHDPYWRPPKKPAPVYHYTQEEIDKLNAGMKEK